ncbi:hypothetical protein Droror1_Dr00020480 [Drosera rotundifolia]
MDKVRSTLSMKMTKKIDFLMAEKEAALVAACTREAAGHPAPIVAAPRLENQIDATSSVCSVLEHPDPLSSLDPATNLCLEQRQLHQTPNLSNTHQSNPVRLNRNLDLVAATSFPHPCKPLCVFLPASLSFVRMDKVHSHSLDGNDEDDRLFDGEERCASRQASARYHREREMLDKLKHVSL